MALCRASVAPPPPHPAPTPSSIDKMVRMVYIVVIQLALLKICSAPLRLLPGSDMKY